MSRNSFPAGVRHALRRRHEGRTMDKDLDALLSHDLTRDLDALLTHDLSLDLPRGPTREPVATMQRALLVCRRLLNAAVDHERRGTADVNRTGVDD